MPTVIEFPCSLSHGSRMHANRGKGTHVDEGACLRGVLFPVTCHIWSRGPDMDQRWDTVEYIGDSRCSVDRDAHWSGGWYLIIKSMHADQSTNMAIKASSFPCMYKAESVVGKYKFYGGIAYVAIAL